LGSFSYQPLPFSNVGVRWDIAHTTNKVFTSVFNNIREYNISSCPFSSTFVREINITSSFARVGDGLFAINDTTLLSWELYGVNSSGWSNDLPIRIMRINLNSNNNIDTSNVNFLFDLPIDRIPAGDLILTTNNKLILFTRDIDNDVFISQFNYPSGGSPEVDIQIPQYSYVYPGLLHLSLFVDNGQMYIIDGDGLVHSIDNTYPYTITEYFNFGFNQVGTSQIQSCINVEFVPYVPQVTYYVYKLCNDTVGPQTYVYQTLPSITTVPDSTFKNEEEGNCWSFVETTAVIPTNSTDDIVVYQGNYFTEVSSTIYTDCTDCINNLPCERPPNVQTYVISRGWLDAFTFAIYFDNIDNICSQVNDLYIYFQSDEIEGVSLLAPTLNNGFHTCQVVSLELGSTVYGGISDNCNCIQDGTFYISDIYDESQLSQSSLDIDEVQNFVGGYAVRIENCVITEIIKCCYPIYIQVSTNPSTICASQGTPIYVNGDQPELYNGMTLYSDGNCSVPLTPDFGGLSVPTINYVKMMGTGYPTRYQMNNNGVISTYNC
jgi:hypothetical protein